MSALQYLEHLTKFARNITSMEELELRLGNFERTHEWIEEHNATGANWVAAHNKFSDWTDAEYKAILGRD